MLDLHAYRLFLAAALVLVLTPGPDTVPILSRTLASGARPGLATPLGTQLGNVVRAMLAGIGVSTVILLFPAARPGRFFVQELASNLSNPKMIAFFLALFAQFVRPEHGSLALQGVVLGRALAATGVMWIGMMAALVVQCRDGVLRHPAFPKLANRLAAVTFVGLACRLAAERR